MSDDKAVMYAIGFLEGWINKAEEFVLDNANGQEVNNADSARSYLSIVEGAFLEQARLIKHYQKIFGDLKQNISSV